MRLASASGRTWVIVLVGLVLLIAGFAFAQYLYTNRLIDAQRELNNRMAALDSLRLVVVSQDSMVRVYERLSFTAASERELWQEISDELRARLRDTDRRLRAVLHAHAEARDSIRILTTAEVIGDSTVIPLAHEDSVFVVDGRVSFPGRIEPDETPEVKVFIDALARIGFDLSLSCDPGGAPFAEATTFDRRVSIEDLEVHVDEEVGCLARRRPSFLELLPRPTLGTMLLGGGAFIAGIVVGNAVSN